MESVPTQSTFPPWALRVLCIGLLLTLLSLPPLSSAVVNRNRISDVHQHRTQHQQQWVAPHAAMTSERKYLHTQQHRSGARQAVLSFVEGLRKAKTTSMLTIIGGVLAGLVVILVVAYACSPGQREKRKKKKLKSLAAAQEQAALLAGTDWQQFFDTEGRAYYFNEVTGHTQWEHPVTKSVIQVSKEDAAAFNASVASGTG
ncbi:unnamed protein product [Vitrella brassicaformis CCMP3155]|uniref:WW domain-containing protein n=1 Tax=Vitrella brassicaformis (strain CCMP3155) TaxID=1169540 RepID=A0A0G4H1U2_VITBC|nr:unnamed protein product [Vitrella brassicaformis CCMP3155]|eukprot:CEM37613.1 unnamed protein product [Vitrella brassicaformis CCMP3155]